MDQSILDRLDRQAKERGDRPAVADPRSDRYDAWDTMTWSEYRDYVYRIARAFISLGHQPKDAVGIIGPNRLAWVASDLAAIAIGGLPAGIYATSTAEQAEYILADSGASIAVVCDRAQAEKVISVRSRLPKLRAIVLFKGAPKPDAPGVYTWEEMLAKADGVEASAFEARRSALRVEDPATLIYTSGTTGPPKGVVLTNRNLLWTAERAAELADVRPGDRCLSYLPLAHIAEQMLTIHGPVTIGVTAHFVPVLEHLPIALPQVRPHFLFGVPRVWEKIEAKVLAAAAAAPPARQKLLAAARKIGLEVTRARFEGKKPGAASALLFPVFERLVFSKFRARIGLDHARVIVTGAAPL
jgi:long-subunit acyl-CoA synthetase (AMP-forming)